MEYSFLIYDGVITVKLKGDFLGHPEEKSFIRDSKLFTRSGITDFIIDATHINHMNSGGLSMLVRLYTDISQRNGRMLLISSPTQLTKLLKITKLDKVFQTSSSRSKALQTLRLS
ncbi:STAS domain-containing protein [Flammeovirga yaeyamensis]|uniref:STAS domain-containing protein n=1 Tax=Flammeovirga yaeyamensis TaxID=367791 RepID=A0AAX1N1E8_9BACT|nr:MULTISPECIES: STAS domain-containing protein [Flammeovirga]ANQ47433.1 STAS domain-containing protein [Flammeovirga sp. MY04]MBB3698479.1 anti-anti-sigma factor [Flammeovirga yaeyamensis]NMF34172.1 STAS domain-containing protein [Flammeovirga yaeyamensis]QWG01157.1 STAS domain-containing protein [Flammeovirga yaeyamensis]